MKKAVLIGSNGQVGSEIARLWETTDGLRTAQLIGLTHADLEITDQIQLSRTLTELEPDLVINTAGFLRVDECESRAEVACLTNGIALKYLAELCAHLDADLVHFSTDYVFDGEKRTPYVEADNTAPINAYGASKLLGEQFVRYLLPERHLIVRTSGVYGPAGSRNKGGNFIETMLRLAQQGRDLSVVDDQVFSPSYAPDLAASVLTLVRERLRGTVHLTNSGTTSWYHFAALAFELAKLSPNLSPVSTEQYAAPARRPAYSVLDNGLACSFGLPGMRGWEESLANYLSIRGA
jgi:dTDP-4-dehydrorhamnose reductase